MDVLKTFEAWKSLDADRRCAATLVLQTLLFCQQTQDKPPPISPPKSN